MTLTSSRNLVETQTLGQTMWLYLALSLPTPSLSFIIFQHIEFCMDLDTFIILFLPEFLSNRLQTLAQWSLDFGEVCYDLSKSYIMISRFYSGFSGSLCGSATVQLFTCRDKPMIESWLSNRGPLSEATRPTLWAPTTFKQLKYICLTSNNVSMWGQRRRELLSIEPTLGAWCEPFKFYI